MKMGSASSFLAFYLFLFGLCIGSFVNVMIYRLPRMLFGPFLAVLYFFLGQHDRIPPKENLFYPFSYCPACHHRLSAFDLIPFFGFFLRRGKCAYCRTPISWQYPFVELCIGLFYVALFLAFGLSYRTLSYLYLVPVLIAIFFIDLRTYLIPDGLTLPSLLVGFFLSFKTIGWKQALSGCLVGGLFFYSIALFSLYVYPKKEGMGLGDVKLMAMLGTFLGVKCLIVSMYISFLLGGVLALFLILFRIKGRYDVIPFGPALVLGALLSLFFCEPFLSFYQNFTNS